MMWQSKETEVKVSGTPQNVCMDDLKKWIRGDLPEVHNYALMDYDERCRQLY